MSTIQRFSGAGSIAGFTPGLSGRGYMLPRLDPDAGGRLGEDRFHEYGSAGGHGPELAGPVMETAGSRSPVRNGWTWEGMSAGIIHLAGRERLRLSYSGPAHLLVVYEECRRRTGESVLGTLARSSQHDISRKLTFVPAGSSYREGVEPEGPARMMFFCFDAGRLQAHTDAGLAGTPFAARLHFEDATLLETALKLKRSLEVPAPEDRGYLQALGIVLVHELVRLHRGAPRPEHRLRGGLAPWQQRAVTGYIDQHLGEGISLARLAALARLSPHYFCRAFKQSFGMSPVRYHTGRRVDHAKVLLAERSRSVTDIGFAVGYSDTSSFTTAFRRATGLTPSAYRRRQDEAGL